MKRSLFAALATLLLAVLAACGGGDTAEGHRTGTSMASLSMPTQAPVPVKPATGAPSWHGTAAELMFADALAICAYPLEPVEFAGVQLYIPFDDDAFVESVRVKMVNAACHYDTTSYHNPARLPEDWWLQQRNDRVCNRDASTNAERSADLARADLMALDVPVELPFGGSYASFTAKAVRRVLGSPITNLCIAQHLRSSSPGVSGAAALLLSAADQRQLLLLTKERAQMAMLQFALLGRTLASPRLAEPEHVSNVEYNPGGIWTGGYPASFIPMLQHWAQAGAASDDVLRKLGQDFATAVLLHVTASSELAQALTRSGAAHLPRGASIRDPGWAASGRLDASVDTWGPGAWRERALASLYGGDPLVEDSSGSTPWQHFLDARGPGESGLEATSDWPDVGDASFVSARVKDPKVHQLLSLATEADALYLRKTQSWAVDPMSRYECREVDLAASAEYLLRATEAHLRTTACSNFELDAGAPLDSGTCQSFSVDDIPMPSTTSEVSYELWTRHRISLQHAHELVAYLKDLIGKECRRERVELDVTGAPVPTLSTFWNRGARGFSGQIASVTLPSGGGDHYHLVDFTLRDRELPETAGLYSRYSGFFIPNQVFPEADPATQGFSGGDFIGWNDPEDEVLGFEEMRLMGAIPALAATRDALVHGIADAAVLVGSACERVTLYFDSARPALEVIETAIGRSGVALLPRVEVVNSPFEEPGSVSLERKVVRSLAPNGSTPTHDLYVTFDSSAPFWAELGTAAAEYKLVAVPDDPTIMDLASYPGSMSFGREIEAALANPRRAGDVALTVLPWSTHGTATTRVASAPLALPRSDEQWAFIVRKQTTLTGLVEYVPLASHVEKFSLSSWNTGQYLAFGGALGDLAMSIVATDPSDPAMPARDGFGLPNTWLPPTDPALFAGNAGEDAVAAYLRKARVSAEEATAAVKEALETMLETQHDQAALAAEVSRSEKVAELERSALCGSSTCNTSMASLVLSPGAIWGAAPSQRSTLRRDAEGALVQDSVGRPAWTALAGCKEENYATMSAARRLDCVAKNVLSPRVATPAGLASPWSPPAPITDFVMWLLEPVVAARNAQTVPSFGEYSGGTLQTIAIEQWTALRGVEDRVRAVIAATDAAIGSVNVYKSELAVASEEEAAMKARCDGLLTTGEEYAADWSDERSESWGWSISQGTSSSYSLGIPFVGGVGGGSSNGSSTSYGSTQMTTGAKRRLCESYRDKVTSAAWRLQEAVLQASANIQSRAADFSEAMGRLKAASAAGYALQHQADLAVARAKLEVDLLRQSQTTSFGLYRQIHSYDAWRAKSLLEGARLSAAVARKAIESRFLVHLSELKSPEPLVASPSAWADEVYEYDLDMPAAVGLSVGESIAGGIYANRMVDYVGNLERFVNGYSIARPTSVARDDTEVVSLPGPAGLDPGALPGTDLPDGRAHAWAYFCPDGPNAGWRPAPPTDGGTLPSETCGPPPAHPTRAALLFALDSWGRLHGDIADEPFEKRYNARWGRLALNLVGTGILDCAKARDPGACYTQPFVRYRLAHRPPSWVTDADGSWRLMPITTGRIEAAKALAAEQWLDPISNAWSKPFVTAIARDELTVRPFGGSYEIELEIGPEVVLERIQRVQLLASSSYWVKQH